MSEVQGALQFTRMLTGSGNANNKEHETKSPQISAFDFLERSAKVVLASLALLYAAGLFVTNFALRSLDITDFSSLRAKYVATGLDI